MMNFIIESRGDIKERFSYERPLNEGSQHALLEYARANYGRAAVVRNMTPAEEADYATNAAFQAGPPE
jgi:hypothetical protein